MSWRWEWDSLSWTRKDFCYFHELDISRRPKCGSASSKLFLLCAIGLFHQTTDPVDRRWWKQGCTPRLRSIFRSQGRRFFFFLFEGKDGNVIQSSSPLQKLGLGMTQEAYFKRNSAKGQALRHQILWWSSCFSCPKTRQQKFEWVFSLFVLFMNCQRPQAYALFWLSCERLKPVFFLLWAIKTKTIIKPQRYIISS